MKFLPSRKTVCRIAGIGLVGIGIAAASIWFGWLVPALSRFDPYWELQFSKHGYWTQVQHHIRRYGWHHEDFEVVGALGDKTWAEWIMQKAERGEDIVNCSVGHKDGALQFITCQDPDKENGERRERRSTEKAWLAWWKENRDKPQVDWIREGLAQYAATVQLPASPEDHEPLLTLLGNTNTNQLDGAPDHVPRYVKYNAFRWLRDSGFEPLSFAVSNVNSETPDTVKGGLVHYSKLAKLYPDLDGAGILPLGKPPFVVDESRRPYFFSSSFQVKAYGIILIPVLLGSCLLVLGFRLDHRRRGRAVASVVPTDQGAGSAGPESAR